MTRVGTKKQGAVRPDIRASAKQSKKQLQQQKHMQKASAEGLVTKPLEDAASHPWGPPGHWHPNPQPGPWNPGPWNPNPWHPRPPHHPPHHPPGPWYPPQPPGPWHPPYPPPPPIPTTWYPPTGWRPIPGQRPLSGPANGEVYIRGDPQTLNYMLGFARQRGFEMCALQSDTGWGDQRYYVFFRGDDYSVRECERYGRQISGW